MSYDVLAYVKAMTENHDGRKGFYYGWSQGTIQMFYGLAHMESTFHADNLHKVVQMAPCFVSAAPITKELEDNTLMKYQDYGVYAIHGPNWE